ncbi:MAG: hypothetical protein J2O38_03380, partial [Acidimicrobiales bacterium]|nr:hypothetical protein [Acidimicrobiales bacterium]
MRSVRARLRGFALLVELAFSADRRGATLAFSPIFPVMAGVSFAAMRVLITAVIHHDTSETIAAGVVFGVALCISLTLGRIGNTARLHVGEAMGRELERRLIGIV